MLGLHGPSYPFSPSGFRTASAAARICGVTSITWPSTPLTKPGDSSVDSCLASSTASSTATGSGTSLAYKKLPDRHAQDGAIDSRQPLQRPALQMGTDEFVDMSGVLGDAAGDCHRVRIQLGDIGVRRRKDHPALCHLFRGQTSRLSLEEQVNRTLAGLMPALLRLAVTHRPTSGIDAAQIAAVASRP